MNRMKSILGVALIALLWVGTPNRAEAQTCYDFASCAPAEIVNSCFEESANGCIDWENGIIYAIGIGVPNEKLKSQSQKNFSAVRAATVVAQRNMLEMIQGVDIDSETIVENGIAESDSIRSRVNGTIRRVQTVGDPDFLNDGSVAVTVRYFMNELSSLFLGRNNPYSRDRNNSRNNNRSDRNGNDPYGNSSSAENSNNSSDESNSGSNVGNTVYTGLIIDATGLGVRPALSPKLLDRSGNLVYGLEKTDREFNLTQGIAGYAKTVDSARDNSRVGSNPLILKATGVEGPNPVDVVISDNDGRTLDELYTTQSFLREGRVIIVLD